MKSFAASLLLALVALSASTASAASVVAVTQSTKLVGYSAGFAGSPNAPLPPAQYRLQGLFRAAAALEVGANFTDVTLHNMEQKTGFAQFDVRVATPAGPKVALRKAKMAQAGFGVAMTSAFDKAVRAQGLTPAVGMAVTVQPPSEVAVTPPPTPAPPPAPKARKPYKPSASVKKLHGYVGTSNEKFNYKKTKDGVLAVTFTGVALAVLALLSYYLFLFMQRCCGCLPKPLKCCYKAQCGKDHHGPTKAFQILLFLLVGGLMCGSIKGRNSFHKASDTIGKALSGVGTSFDVMHGAATDMGTTQVKNYNDATALLTTNSGSSSSPSYYACPFNGENYTPGTNGKGAWNSAMHSVVTPIKAELSAPIGLIGTAATEMTKLLKGQGKSMRDIAKFFKDDMKKAIDMGVGATVAFAVFVALFGVLGTMCLTSNSGKQAKGFCCNLSTLLIFLCNFFGFIFLILLIVFIAIELSASTFLSDVCFITPESAILTMMKEEGKVEASQMELLNYYMTCQGNNTLADKLGSATDNIAKLQTKLTDVSMCDAKLFQDTLPMTLNSAGVLLSQLSCPHINGLFKQFTQDAVCTHLVDGLYFLWTVQAASGVLLLVALYSMALVQQSFYAEATTGKVQPELAAPADGQYYDGDGADYAVAGAVVQQQQVEMVPMGGGETATEASEVGPPQPELKNGGSAEAEADNQVAGAVAATVAATAPAYDAEPMQDEAVDAMANANAEGDE
jgi:hypothetical protein